MSNNIEQQITKRDLQAIIEESNRHRKWEYCYKLAKIIITPLIITLVSMFVTWRINVQQAENTKKITAIEIESAKIIAAANREHSAKLSESQQRIERLDHIKDIFGDFLANDEKKKNGGSKSENQKFEAAKMQIISLEVYKEDALIFLINIRDHCKKKIKENSLNKLQKKNYLLLAEQADQSVENILLHSQINLSKRIFMNCIFPETCKYLKNKLINLDNHNKLRKSILNKHEINAKPNMIAGKTFLSELKKDDFNEINLRKQEYKNYDFTNCFFIKANLYSSDFSSCTLNNSLFINVDLQEATFSRSNLSGSIFYRSNLKKGNFKDSKLNNVVFVNPVLNIKDADQAIKKFCTQNSCCELEGAQFSLGSLLWTRNPPFDVFDRERNKVVAKALRKEWQNLYINLLMHHRKSIVSMVETAKEGDVEEEENLKILMKNTGANSEQKLIELLTNAAEKNKILATNDTPQEQFSLTDY